MLEDEQDEDVYLSDDPLASSEESEDEAEDTAADEISELMTKFKSKTVITVRPARKQTLEHMQRMSSTVKRRSRVTLANSIMHV